VAAAEQLRRWVTLNEAADAAGVTIGQFTAWYLRDEIASRLERGPHGERRLLDLDEVLARARPGVSPEPPVLRALPDAGGAASGVLVPLEAWQRALEQLAHLHELAREVGDAKAQAAKYETTTEFQRERVRELKDELAQARAPRRRRLFRR
jgi:hypothetical protein